MPQTESLPVSFEQIQAAADRIRDHVIETPVVRAPALDHIVGAELHFKCENLQHVGAFKARGACNAVFQLTEQQAASGVVAHSSGNHAAALARAARVRGIDAHIVMPSDSSPIKIAAVRNLGVEPRFCEPTADARQQMADEVIAETGAIMIHPYNDERVIAGQGTTTLEFLKQVPELDVLVMPVGGGGLASGALIAAREMNPELVVIGAEPAWADDAYRSLQAGGIQKAERFDSVADGLRAPLGTLTFPIISSLISEILLASELMIRWATNLSICHGKLVVEPSGAVPLAAIMEHRERFAGKRIGVIISGGNADPQMFSDILAMDPPAVGD